MLFITQHRSLIHLLSDKCHGDIHTTSDTSSGVTASRAGPPSAKSSRCASRFVSDCLGKLIALQLNFLDNGSTAQGEADSQSMNIDAGNADTASEAPIEVIDIEDEGRSTAPHPEPPSQAVQVQPNQQSQAALDIDICFEASKLPLDVAIFNSARAAGGDEKIRKYLQAVLVIGGSALIPGMSHALESR